MIAKEFDYKDHDGKRFIEKLNKVNGCWLWIGSYKSAGYGQFSYKNKTTSAHRFSWIYHNGEIPKGLMVLHKCDVRRCVNPEHLFLGTAQDNSDDMVSKNRQGDTSGERNSRAKLTDRQVVEIRRKYSANNTRGMQARLAEEYGVQPAAINRIVNGKLRMQKKQTPYPTREPAALKVKLN